MTWATNAFVFISGWYGIRFSWSRLMRFLGMGLFAMLVSGALSPFACGDWRLVYDLGWFGNSYLALMLLSPLLNAGLESLYAKSYAALFSAWTYYLVAMSLSWLPLRFLGINLNVEGWWGHSFNTLVFVYVSAFVLRRSKWFAECSRMRAIMAFAAALVGHVLLCGLMISCPLGRRILSHALDYDSPCVLIMSAAIFLVFCKTEFPCCLQRMCGVMAPSMFVVYLLHSSFSGRAMMNRFLLSLDGVLGILPLHRVWSVLIGGGIVFIVCVIVDALRRYLYSLMRSHSASP